MRISTRRHRSWRAGIAGFVAAVAVLAAGAPAQAKPTTISFTLIALPGDPGASGCSPPAVTRIWASGGVLHIRGFPLFSTLSGTTSLGGALTGTGCGFWNANLTPADCLDFASPSFGACEGEEWGSGVTTLSLDGAPLGSWLGHYQGRWADGVSLGDSVGTSAVDESALRLEYTACLVCGADEMWTGTISYPHG